jgi:hypothetical protein
MNLPNHLTRSQRWRHYCLCVAASDSSTNCMRTIALLASILIATSFVPLLQAEEIIKDKSPDKKLALRMTHSEEGLDTAIIETATKKKVIDSESVALSGDKDRIVWMSDSSKERSGLARQAR